MNRIWAMMRLLEMSQPETGPLALSESVFEPIRLMGNMMESKSEFKSKLFGILILLSLALFAFQNCSEVRLLGVGNNAVKGETIVTPPTIITPTTQVDPPDETGDSGQYNQTEETTDACGGSYRFEESLVYRQDNGDLRSVQYRLKDRTNDRYIRPESWSAIPQGVPINEPPSYSFDIGTIQGCQIIALQAHFKNACGQNVSLGHIFTWPGCPEPQPQINVTCDQILRPQGQTRLTRAYKKMTYLEQGTWEQKPVSTLVEATAFNPNQVVGDFIKGTTNFIRIPNGSYLSLAFTAPTGLTGNDAIANLWTMQTGNPFGVTMAISECEGDFYLGRAPKGCMTSGVLVEGQVGINFDPSRQLAGTCNLTPGKKYYMNIIGFDFLRNRPVGPPDTTEVIWPGGVR